jgi:hypothetical protein
MYQEIKHWLPGVLFAIEFVLLLIVLHMQPASDLVEMAIRGCALISTIAFAVFLCVDGVLRDFDNDHFRYNQARYLHARYV